MSRRGKALSLNVTAPDDRINGIIRASKTELFGLGIEDDFAWQIIKMVQAVTPIKRLTGTSGEKETRGDAPIKVFTR